MWSRFHVRWGVTVGWTPESQGEGVQALTSQEVA